MPRNVRILLDQPPAFSLPQVEHPDCLTPCLINGLARERGPISEIV